MSCLRRISQNKPVEFYLYLFNLRTKINLRNEDFTTSPNETMLFSKVPLGLLLWGSARATNTCIGASVDLSQEQCSGWIAFFDATGGDGWGRATGWWQGKWGTGLASRPGCGNLRLDPCACSGFVECSADGANLVGM